jgi:uncharacterized protein (TIGR02172 family)
MNEISLDQPLARGRTADVFVWDEGHVLKLFHNWFEPENIQYEQRISQAVVASGVKAPLAGDVIRVNDRSGLIYERVAGISMEQMFLRKPWKMFTYARILARLHAQMHERIFEPAIPAQKTRLENKINRANVLTAALKTKLLDALESLPEGERVCHGDFHPANVLLSEHEATVIDWIDATRGNPLADVARTSIIALGGGEALPPPHPFLKAWVQLFHSSYLNNYFALHPGGREEHHHWLPIMAGARLSENIPESEAWLVEQAHKIIT